MTAPSWPSLSEAMALPVQPTTTEEPKRDTQARRPANVVPCSECGTEMIYHVAPSPDDVTLCTVCEETMP